MSDERRSRVTELERDQAELTCEIAIALKRQRWRLADRRDLLLCLAGYKRSRLVLSFEKIEWLQGRLRSTAKRAVVGRGPFGIVSDAKGRSLTVPKSVQTASGLELWEVFVGSAEEPVEALAKSGDHEELGRSLGVPECCRESYSRTVALSRRSGLDATDLLPLPAGLRVPLLGNFCLESFGRGFLGFVPCRFDCPAASEEGLRRALCLRDIDPRLVADLAAPGTFIWHPGGALTWWQSLPETLKGWCWFRQRVGPQGSDWLSDCRERAFITISQQGADSVAVTASYEGADGIDAFHSSECRVILARPDKTLNELWADSPARENSLATLRTRHAFVFAPVEGALSSVCVALARAGYQMSIVSTCPRRAAWDACVLQEVVSAAHIELLHVTGGAADTLLATLAWQVADAVFVCAEEQLAEMAPMGPPVMTGRATLILVSNDTGGPEGVATNVYTRESLGQRLSALGVASAIHVEVTRIRPAGFTAFKSAQEALSLWVLNRLQETPASEYSFRTFVIPD